MASKIVQRLATGFVPMVVLFLLLLLSLYVLGNTAENLATFGRFYIWLLALNALGLVFITALIAINTWNLVKQFRQRAAGARLTARLVIMFVVLALVPVTIVYSFSVKFIRSGIDSWFDVQVSEALDQAVKLSRDSMGQQMRTLLRLTTNMTEPLADLEDEAAIVALTDLRLESGAAELTLLSASNRVIAATSVDEAKVVPNRPSDSILRQVKESGPYVGLDPVGDSGLYIRVVVEVLSSDPIAENRLLHALYPVADRLSNLADSVQEVFSRYRQLTYLRDPLKVSFILTLSLVLLLSVLTAVWAAFYSARRLMLPIHDLADGTQAVAAGNYSTVLPASGSDELGFLVRSFNEMTGRLAQARDEARTSQAQVERQRAYLEAVLARLSTGVLTLSSSRVLRTANEAAGQILGIEIQAHLGENVNRLAVRYPHLKPFLQSLQPQLDRAAAEWSEELEVFGPNGRRVLVVRGARLPDIEGQEEGYVLVFDDITALIRAQRDAAWSEVARRLAHEIKNPLTPIQLAAERLRRKYLDKMPPEDASLLDRSTHTIVQQVESMKSMVKAFADYANTPVVKMELLDLNVLINDVAHLYRGLESPLYLRLQLEQGLPALQIDATRMRQLLHNLIRNAMEAQPPLADAEHRPELSISTHQVEQSGYDYVELAFVDEGPGFPPDLLDRLFEPYVTSKQGGTGLGLAIVKKIVEEHGGTVRAGNLPEQGAEVLIQLPVPAVSALGIQAGGETS